MQTANVVASASGYFRMTRKIKAAMEPKNASSIGKTEMAAPMINPSTICFRMKHRVVEIMDET